MNPGEKLLAWKKKFYQRKLTWWPPIARTSARISAAICFAEKPICTSVRRDLHAGRIAETGRRGKFRSLGQKSTPPWVLKRKTKNFMPFAPAGDTLRETTWGSRFE